MLTFKQFISEEHNEVLDIDVAHAEKNKDAMNDALDVLTEKPYQNAPIFLAQLRGVFERYGILIPASATPHFMNLDAELVYKLGDSENYIYITYDTNDDGFVDGYAQIVDQSELNDLLGMKLEEFTSHNLETRHRHLPARRDDDAGDTSQYSPYEGPTLGWEAPSQVSTWTSPSKTSDWTAPAQIPNP